MKKLIVVVALLLIACIAFSVSAFGVNVSFGQKDYNLGSFTSTPPTLDGSFGRYEYTTVYTLTSAGGYLDKNGDPLSRPMNAAGATRSLKVGIAHDVSFIYIAIEAVLGSGVENVKYDLAAREYNTVLYADISEDDSDNEFSKLDKGVFVGEFRIEKNDYTDTVIASETVILEVTDEENVAIGEGGAVLLNEQSSESSEEVSTTDTEEATTVTESVETFVETIYYDQYFVTEGEFELKILEETKDYRGNVINYAVWNAVRVNSFNKMLNNGNDFAYNTFTIGTSSSKVTVENNMPSYPNPNPAVTVRPPILTYPEATTAPEVTTAPETTTAPEATTVPETTAPETTTEPDTLVTDPETTAPVQSESQSQSAPAVTEPAKTGNCKNSVTGLGIALISLLGAGATVLSRKED